MLGWTRNNQQFINNIQTGNQKTQALCQINDMRNFYKNNLAKNNFSRINSICSMMMIVLTTVAEILNDNISLNDGFYKQAIILTKQLTKTNPK